MKQVISLTGPAMDAFEAIKDGYTTSDEIAQHLGIKTPAASGRLLNLYLNGAVHRINPESRGQTDPHVYGVNDVEIKAKNIYKHRGKKRKMVDRTYADIGTEKTFNALDAFIYKRNYQ